MDAEATVLAGTFQAHEDAVGDGGPLWVLLGAVHAHLVPGLGLELPEPSRCRHLVGSEGRCGSEADNGRRVGLLLHLHRLKK